MNTRPNWGQTFLDIAEVLARRATCPRLQTAAVIVSPDLRILSTGYNGAPSGETHCLDAGCLIEDHHCVRSVHAELNAILNAARNGISINGSAIYVLHTPCIRCAIAMAQAGIWEVHYRYDYGSSSGLARLDSLNVAVFKHENT